MKKDELEDFIKTNRDSFYDEVPPVDAWENIQKSIVKKPRNILPVYLRMAAAAFFLIAVTFAATRYFVLNDIVRKGNGFADRNYSIKNEIPVKVKQENTKEKAQVKVENKYVANSNTNTTKVKSNKKSNPAYPDIEEINMYYSSQIYSRKNEIFRYVAVSGEINDQVNTEINQMDSIYRSVVRDLKDNMNNKEVVESLILQYRLKLEFLDNVLQLIKENENPSQKNPKYEM